MEYDMEHVVVGGMLSPDTSVSSANIHSIKFSSPYPYQGLEQ
jgi:hypothetical protein